MYGLVSGQWGEYIGGLLAANQIVRYGKGSKPFVDCKMTVVWITCFTNSTISLGEFSSSAAVTKY